MKESSKYKRFKRINFASNTYTLLDMRSSIIRTIQGYHSHANTANSRRSKKQAQINEIDTQKTNKLLSVCDRALLALSYYNVITRSDNFIVRAQGVKKLKTYLIFEMLPILVYYSYEQKYHKLTSMFIPDYQCSNIYIDNEKRASMNKDIQ
jgi:hypothetical protein